MLRACLLGLILFLAIANGCRRRSEPTPATAEPSSSSGTSVAAPNAPAAHQPPTPPAASAPGGAKAEDRLPTAPSGSYKTVPVDKKLTEALQRHVEATGKMPSDFNALVTGKYLAALPTPPPGKRFAVDRANLQVVVLDQ